MKVCCYTELIENNYQNRQAAGGGNYQQPVNNGNFR